MACTDLSASAMYDEKNGAQTISLRYSAVGFNSITYFLTYLYLKCYILYQEFNYV